MNRRLNEKIKKSMEIFKDAYSLFGSFSLGFGYGNTDSPNYHRLLNADGTSKVVGNSSFSPRIRMVPVYNNGRREYGYPDCYCWVLSVHSKLHDGIKEYVNPRKIQEINIKDSTNTHEVLDMVRDFLKLSNKEVMEMFKIPEETFSEESRRIMKDVDRRNALIYRAEESLEEFKANYCQEKEKKNKEKMIY